MYMHVCIYIYIYTYADMSGISGDTKRATCVNMPRTLIFPLRGQTINIITVSSQVSICPPS